MILQMSSFIANCQRESLNRQHSKEHKRNLVLILKEVEKISKQVDQHRDDLLNLEGRLDGLTSIIKQMILHDDLVSIYTVAV